MDTEQVLADPEGELPLTVRAGERPDEARQGNQENEQEQVEGHAEPSAVGRGYLGPCVDDGGEPASLRYMPQPTSTGQGSAHADPLPSTTVDTIPCVNYR